MISERGMDEHAGSREGKDPLQLSLFEAGGDEQP